MGVYVCVYVHVCTPHRIRWYLLRSWQEGLALVRIRRLWAFRIGRDRVDWLFS